MIKYAEMYRRANMSTKTNVEKNARVSEFLILGGTLNAVELLKYGLVNGVGRSPRCPKCA